MNIVKSAAIAAVATLAALPVYAQQPPRPPSPPRPPMERGEPMRREGVSVEAALRMREPLKLNNSQIDQLETLRKEIVAQRQNNAREMIDLQSRIAAGQLERWRDLARHRPLAGDAHRRPADAGGPRRP